MPFPILKEYLNMADYTTSGYNDTQNLADKYKNYDETELRRREIDKEYYTK